MLTLRTFSPMELRGIAHRTSANGKDYYIVNAEDEEGFPNQFYCPDGKVFPKDLKKGDKVYFQFTLHRFENNERLVLRGVERVTRSE